MDRKERGDDQEKLVLMEVQEQLEFQVQSANQVEKVRQLMLVNKEDMEYLEMRDSTVPWDFQVIMESLGCPELRGEMDPMASVVQMEREAIQALDQALNQTESQVHVVHPVEEELKEPEVSQGR